MSDVVFTLLNRWMLLAACFLVQGDASPPLPLLGNYRLWLLYVDSLPCLHSAQAPDYGEAARISHLTRKNEVSLH